MIEELPQQTEISVKDVYDEFEWKTSDIKLGSFEQKQVEHPTHWSLNAVKIVAQ